MKRYSKAVVNLAIAFVLFLLIVWLLPKALVFFSPFVAGLDYCPDCRTYGAVF